MKRILVTAGLGSSESLANSISWSYTSCPLISSSNLKALQQYVTNKARRMTLHGCMLPVFRRYRNAGEVLTAAALADKYRVLNFGQSIRAKLKYVSSQRRLILPVWSVCIRVVPLARKRFPGQGGWAAHAVLDHVKSPKNSRSCAWQGARETKPPGLYTSPAAYLLHTWYY